MDRRVTVQGLWEYRGLGRMRGGVPKEARAQAKQEQKVVADMQELAWWPGVAGQEQVRKPEGAPVENLDFCP